MYYLFGGGGFEGFKAVLMVLVIGQAVNMVLNTHGVLLGMTEHSADLKRVYRTMLPINFIFNITLIPTMGVMGAAVSTSITLVLTNLSLAIMARRKVFGSVW